MRVSHFDNRIGRKIWFDLTVEDHECEPVIFETGGPHEEGYSYTHTRYWLSSDGMAYCQVETESRDCDGPLDSASVYEWQNDGWKVLQSSQYDHNAAMMGY